MQGSKQETNKWPDFDEMDDAESIDEMTSLEAAISWPSKYIEVLAGAEGDVVPKKELGFIIRRSDIHSVRAYVRAAKLLPVDNKSAIALLGFATAGVPELDTTSIHEFHQSVVRHAETWPKLERETKELSRELNKFSDSFITLGQFIIGLIDRVDISRFVKGTLDDLTDEEINEVRSELLDTNNLDAVGLIKGCVLDMKKNTLDYVNKVHAVSKLAAEFERVLSDELIHAVNRKLEAYAGIALSRERQAMVERIKQLDSEIEQAISDYRSQVLYGHSGILMGPIGLAITGGIFGVKAENTRARKNQLIAERDRAIKNNKDQEWLVTMLDTTQQHFVDLSSRMFGAEQGAKQLAQVWGFIAKYLDEAGEQLDTVDTFAALHKFKLDFSQLLNPWKRVSDYTVQISAAFNDMLEEPR